MKGWTQRYGFEITDGHGDPVRVEAVPDALNPVHLVVLENGLRAAACLDVKQARNLARMLEAAADRVEVAHLVRDVGQSRQPACTGSELMPTCDHCRKALCCCTCGGWKNWRPR